MTPFATGAVAALGAPALASGATFLAFGAIAQGYGLSPLWALAASGGIYGMAGQMVLLEAATVGALPATLGAVAANARFLPMAVAIAPWLGRRRWFAAPFLAVTTWAVAMRVLPGLPEPQRLPWFLGFGAVAWSLGLLATLAGYAIAPSLDAPTRALLLFANPLYFGLLLAAELPRRDPRRAILAGIAAAPVAILLPPGWGLIAAGLLGGTAAFGWGRWRDRP